MAFHSPMASSSSALSAHLHSSPHQLGQLHLHPRLQLSRRSLPLRLRLCIPRLQLPPLALPSSNDGNINNSGDGGQGGGGDGGESDGNRRAALSVLAQLGRKLESLPDDFAAALEGGRVTGETVRRFVNMDASSLHHWLLQLRGFRERLLADEHFLAKAAMECGVGVLAKTAAEYEKKRDKFIKEIDTVIKDVVTAIFADFTVVYLSAPFVSLEPSSRGTIGAIFSEITKGARPFLVLDRIGKIVIICPKLFAIAICSCQVDTVVTNALIKAREYVVKLLDNKAEEIPVVSTACKVEEKELSAHLKVGAELSDGVLNFMNDGRFREIPYPAASGVAGSGNLCDKPSRFSLTIRDGGAHIYKGIYGGHNGAELVQYK